MLIEILLLNSRPCSTYEILNLSRASHSTSLVCFLLLAGGKNHSPNGILFFLEGLRRMTTFLCNIERWEGTGRGDGGGGCLEKERLKMGVGIPGLAPRWISGSQTSMTSSDLKTRAGQMDPFHVNLM